MMCQQRTTRSLLSAGGPSSFTLFFYALSLSLSLCVCVCVCVNIYITTTIRVPSFPFLSFTKGSRVQPKCGVKDTTKISNTSIGTLVSVCFSHLISLVWWWCYFFVVAFSALVFRFLDGFPPTLKRRNVVKVSFSFSRVVVVLLAHALYLRAEKTDRHSSRREKERESFWRQKKSFRERDEIRETR